MLKDFVIYIPSVIIQRLISFLIIYFGSRYLNSESFGLYSIIILIGEFSDISLNNWIRIAIPRFGSHNSGVSRIFIKNIFLISSACLVVSIFLAYLLILFLASEVVGTITYLTSIYILSIVIVRLGFAINQALGRSVFTSTIEILRSSMIIVFVYLSMKNSKNFISPIIFLSSINITFGLIQIYFGYKKTSSSFNPVINYEQLKNFAMQMVFFSFIAQLVSNFDKFFVKSLFSASIFGMYSASFILSRSGFDLLSSALNTGGFVKISREFGSGNERGSEHLINKQFRLILAGSLPSLSILISAKEKIAIIFLPSEYSSIFEQISPYVALGAILINLKSFVFDNIIHINLQNKLQIIPLMLSLFCSLLAAIFLIPNYNALGAAITFLLSSLVNLIVTIFVSRKLYKIKIGVSDACLFALITVTSFVGCELLLFLIGNIDAYISNFIIFLYGGVFVLFSMMIVNSFDSKDMRV